MAYVEIEVKAKTVELAVEAAMKELGVDDADQLSVEVLQEPERGFLGLGGQDAVIRARRRSGKRRRKERKKREKTGNQGNQRASDRQREARSAKNDGGERQRPRSKPGKERQMGRHESHQQDKVDDRSELSLEDQARIAREFLEGLIGAFGLEGEVTAKVEEDVIVVDVSGDQTEALVGVRGSVRAAVHELTRTVIQRYTKDAARLRLDIAGYAERRRQALTIYANRLIDQLLEEGGEIMLEPMSPADRKVIHDAAASREGVSSYSEGESPRRYVVLTLDTEAASSEEE